MQWIKDNNGTAQRFTLLNDEQTMAELKLNEPGGSMRLNYGSKRLFFFHYSSLLEKKLSFTNEYGLPISADLSLDKSSGVVEVESKKLFYKMEHEDLTVYTDRKIALAQSSLPQSLSALQKAALLFATAWLTQQVNGMIA